MVPDRAHPPWHDWLGLASRLGIGRALLPPLASPKPTLALWLMGALVPLAGRVAAATAIASLDASGKGDSLGL